MHAENKRSPWRFRILPSLSLAQRVLLWVLPLSLLGIFVSSLVLYRAAKTQILTDVRKEVEDFSLAASLTLERFFAQRLNDLDLLAESTMLKDYGQNRRYGLKEEAEAYRKELEAYFDRVSKRTASYESILYADAKGNIEIGGRGRLESGLLSRLRALPNDGRWQGDIELKPGTGRRVWRIAKPLRGAGGELSGAVVIACDLHAVEAALSRLRAGKNGTTALIDGSGRALIGTASAPAKSCLVRVAPIHGTPWSVRAEARLEDFTGPLDRIRETTVWLSLLCGAAVFVLILIRVRSLIAPIKDLVEATRRFGEGRLDHRVPVRGEDEIGRLARHFNIMAENLQAASMELQSSESRYRAVVDNSVDAIVGLDARMKVVVWNPGADRIFGYTAEEMAGSTLERLFPPGEYAKLAALAAGLGPLINHETQGLRRCGKALALSLTWAHSGCGEGSEWALVIRDATEEKAILAQLLRSEKLSLTGQLLSGVAHELNNPLTAVLGYADILAESWARRGLPADLKDDLAQIALHAKRCAVIVDNLLLFVRKAHAAKEPVSMRRVIEESLLLLEYSLKKKDRVEVRCDMEKGMPPVLGHLQSLEQVFVNVIQNACAAMAGKEAGRLIEVKARREGDKLFVAIEDNGVGVPPENRERIFEPFFTTRRDGTGLGLAICRQIIRDHGGGIRCAESSLGGAAIVIDLPVAAVPSSCASAPLALPPAAGKRTLIVDDEPGLLSMMQKVLAAEGQVVRTARGGQEALAELGAGRFDLVVCDLHLGEIGVPRILEALAGIEPAPTFLLVTGDVSWENLPESDPLKKLPVLFKPFTPETFRGAVRKLFLKGSATAL